MKNRFPLRLESGEIVNTSLDAEDFCQFEALKDEPTLYFELPPHTFFVPVPLLVLSRLRVEGAKSANRLMRDAAQGHCSKRSPIEVIQLDRDRRLVVDGNSTVTNALLSGWRQVPCLRSVQVD